MEDRTKRAARFIYEARNESRLIDAIPHDCRPTSLEEAYAIQEHLHELMQEPTVGWMLAFTNEKMQKMYDAEKPYYARILKKNLYNSPVRLDVKYEMPMIFECEVAFQMATDLPKRKNSYNVDEVGSAVESMLPSIEIPISNFRKPFELPLATVIAANGIDGPLICGQSVKNWRALNRADIPIQLYVNGEKRTEGRSSEAMGDPLNALTWLANELKKNGKFLRKGDIINTGVCGDPIKCRTGDDAIGDFGDLGRVQVSMIGPQEAINAT